jgi:hypothetical protein
MSGRGGNEQWLGEKRKLMATCCARLAFDALL